jgi:hypothetical protein
MTVQHRTSPRSTWTHLTRRAALRLGVAVTASGLATKAPTATAAGASVTANTARSSAQSPGTPHLLRPPGRLRAVVRLPRRRSQPGGERADLEAIAKRQASCFPHNRVSAGACAPRAGEIGRVLQADPGGAVVRPHRCGGGPVRSSDRRHCLAAVEALRGIPQAHFYRLARQRGLT